MPGMPATANTSTEVQTGHEDTTHDAQLDFYGKRLATCSSDRTVKVFDVNPDGSYGLVDTLKGHEGPVWEVAWAHPKFGSILASCSYDGRAFVWREGQGAGTGWQRVKEHSLHNASVNSIAWAPHELGATLACASSDGKISMVTFKDDGTWDASLFTAHALGVNAVTWSPAIDPGALVQSQQHGAGDTRVWRLATGGCDNVVKVWRKNVDTWEVEATLAAHEDWVRDVSWAPNIGLPRTYIASAGQDKMVYVWVQEGSGTAPWNKVALNPANSPSGSSKFGDAVWRVSWSVSGQVLAVASGDGKVTLWKENLKGAWELVSEMDS